jgi:raffinose/stachyose/melibiose transport system permease protein
MTAEPSQYLNWAGDPSGCFALPVAIFLFVGFYSYFPDELMEAATIDGCGILGLFFRIVIPMSINTVITITTLYGVYSWNEFIFAFTFLSKKSMLTLTLGLRDFVEITA